MRFSLRSALHDVEHALSPERLAIPLHVEGANTRLLALASRLADGGRLAGARRWSLQRWIHLTGVYPQLLPQLEQRGLIRWDGEDLQVLEYVVGHERRIRGYCNVQVPAMMAARGYDPADYGTGVQEYPPRDPPPDPPPGSPPLSTRRSYLHPPLTSRLTSQLTPDPGSAPRRARLRSTPSDPDPSLRTRQRSEPSDPSHEDRGRVSTDGAETGPEGYERWVRAMPVVRPAPSVRMAQRWRDENLAYWARNDLEPEADEILAELERRKLTEAWKNPRWVPDPINFLRAASWRARRPPPAKVRAPTVWTPAAAPEVYEPAPWPAGGATREEFERWMAERKGLS